MDPAYFTRYNQLRMRRDENGILEVRLHTRDGPCLFGPRTHEHMVDAFYDISRDADTRVMILTGTGDSWIAAFDETQGTEKDDFTVPKNWDRVYWEGKKVLQNLLDIDVPVIAAVNGPALVHSEYILTCDAVLASDTVVFQDLPHLAFGLTPGDGVHVLWPHVLGPVRGRYFLTTQQKIGAEEALRLGVVNEVMSLEALMPRAWELAKAIGRAADADPAVHARGDGAAIEGNGRPRGRARARATGIEPQRWAIRDRTRARRMYANSADQVGAPSIRMSDLPKFWPVSTRASEVGASARPSRMSST